VRGERDQTQLYELLQSYRIKRHILVANCLAYDVECQPNVYYS